MARAATLRMTGDNEGGKGLSPLARQVAAKTRAVSARGPRPHRRHRLTALAAATQERGAEILLKREHQQTTGSFKVRGALAKLLSLGADQPRWPWRRG